MSQLVISSNSVSYPLTLTLDQYMDVDASAGMDPQDPQFTTKVWGRSILKEGATLALEQLTEKELVFPLFIGPVGGFASAPTTMGGVATLIGQINEILNTPGATLSWQPPGTSQATVFDCLSGQCDVDYSFRREQQDWTHIKMRVFSQPLGRRAAPRVYAAASGVGPLLMISPYGSGGGNILTASATGFGASPQLGPTGASSGITYFGSPSLAGDAPAQLQISYVGPLPRTASNQGVVPYVAVSLLPDQYYQPLITANQITNAKNIASTQKQQTAVASQYITVGPSPVSVDVLYFKPLASASVGVEPTLQWAGNHRLLAICRASPAPGEIGTQLNPLVSTPTTATVSQQADWGLYDLGTFTLRPSEAPTVPVAVAMLNNTGTTSAIDLAAFVMLPDNATWFMSPPAIAPATYGYPPGVALTVGLLQTGALASSPYTNTVLVDDTLSDQFIYSGQSQTFAPSPIGMAASSGRITQFTRGLVPRPDPRNGLPIVAIVGVGQYGASPVGGVSGGSWLNAQSLQTMVQINVLERARYLLP